jgi:alpha 1,2-mannosyltransferase
MADELPTTAPPSPAPPRLLPVVLGGAATKKRSAQAHYAKRKSHSGSDKKERSLSAGSAAAAAMSGPSAVSSASGGSRRVLGFAFVLACFVCMVCLATLGFVVQYSSIANGEVDGGGHAASGAQRPSILAALKRQEVVARLHRLTSWFSSVEDGPVRQQKTKRELLKLGDYECLGWRQTKNCTPHGDRELEKDRNCSTPIPDGVSGYCEIQHKTTRETTHVMEMHCESLRPGVQFTCSMFQSVLGYSILSTDYVHDANSSDKKNQAAFRRTNKLSDTPIPLEEDGIKKQSVGQLELSFERGIVMVIYEKLLLGAYVSVRSLRQLGSTLPVEMWYRRDETDVNHPLLQLMVAEYGVYLREIDDPRATRFYTKLHAVFYSAFESVLLLDADNFPVRDPSYLFDTPEFTDTGAIFWPDFWKPGNTIFNIHDTSFVWTVFGLDPVDMFEQESGQVLINRRRHAAAMNVLMFYGFSLPRIHEEMRLVWGDKDLFRFAWMKTDSKFFMIQRPPGSAGTKHDDYDLFCGVTMVQHDPSGKVVFLHRNTEKLLPTNDRLVWTHIQQFKRTSSLADFYVRGANGGKVFPQFKRCFGKDVHYEKLFTLKPISAFAFENLEVDLLKFAREGAAILNATGATTAAATTKIAVTVN